MIYYFSGTGNTRYAAHFLACKLNEPIHFICAEGQVPLPSPGERVGFLFPIYSWGVPPVVTQFLDNLPVQALQGRYLWALCTCGDEAGVAMRRFRSHVAKLRGSKPEALFSLIMPNNYVLLPGFDVDSTPVAEAKLTTAPYRLREIAAQISAGRQEIYDVTEGSMPALHTALVFPLFKRWGVSTRRWHASDACSSCGACERACPSRNISLTSAGEESVRPQWGENCLNCCACYHVCPTRAISYGSFTRGKGRYLCPPNLPKE